MKGIDFMNNIHGFVFGYKLTSQEFEKLYCQWLEDERDEEVLLNYVWEIDDNTKIVGMNILILNDEEDNSVYSFNDINKIIAEKRSQSDTFFNIFAPFFNHSLTTNIFNTLPQIFYINVSL